MSHPAQPRDEAKPLRVLAPPPILFALGLLAGWLAERAEPTRLLPESMALRLLLGAPLLVAGLALDVWAIGTLWRHRTTVNPYGRPRRVAVTGPYAWTRNPIYAGYALEYAGLALLLGWAWAFAFLPFVLVLLDWGVVRPEERHLGARFGEEYRRYQERVPRWGRLGGR